MATKKTVEVGMFPKGSGESLYHTDIIGVLVKLEKREGTYDVVDEETGEIIAQPPQSWTAIFEMADGTEGRFSWPTYVDKKTGKVEPWSRFDESIDLAKCAKDRTPIHMWRDENKRTHLELA